MTYKTKSLEDLFGIKKLDVTNRSYAGMYINGHIIIGKEHLQCLSDYRKQHTPLEESKTAILHFIELQNCIVCFIDTLPFLPCNKAGTWMVINAILKQKTNVSEIYAYNYPKTITQLYQK